MTTTQIIEYNEHMMAFLSEHGSDEMLADWISEANQTKLNQELNQLTKERVYQTNWENNLYVSPYAKELPITYTTAERSKIYQALNTVIQLEQKPVIRDKLRAKLLAKRNARAKCQSH